jgi:hypothetical protein
VFAAENSTMRSFPATAPFTETVPSELMETAPPGTGTGPEAPRTGSPAAVTNWPAAETLEFPLRV